MTEATTTERGQHELARSEKLARATRGVEELRASLRDAEREFAGRLEEVAPSMRASALNLVHYLAVRRHDVRELQDQLERLGLSSLGRMEAHVDASLRAVLSPRSSTRRLR
jgi:pyruvate kinase